MIIHNIFGGHNIKMMRNALFLALILCSGTLTAQMEINGQVLYGNEWINYDLIHAEVKVLEEGIYRVTYDDLIAQGIAPGFSGSDLQVYNMGQQQHIHTSTEGPWNADDYLLFYGKAQEGALDSHLFSDAETEQLNPQYSMFSDEASFFIRANPNSVNNNRYQDKSAPLPADPPLPELYFMEREKLVFSSHSISPGTPVTEFVHYSHFITMEGFSTRQQREVDVEFASADYYEGPSRPDGRLIMRTGSNNVDHFIDILFNNSEVASESYPGAQVRQYDVNVPDNFIRKGNTNRAKLKGFSSADNLSIAFTEFHYPRIFNANNQDQVGFYTGSTNFNSYIEYADFNGASPLVFDVENHCFLRAEKQGSTARFLLPPAALKESRALLLDESAIMTPLSMESVSFTAMDNLNPQYLILTTKALNKLENGSNPVSNYAQFRASTLGGGYDVEIIEVEDLYDQFGYGVDEHSISIRNFSAYMKDKWPDFEMVFIIGKGLAYHNKNSNTIAENLVPSYGMPGSDNLLFAVSDEEIYPYVAVGRLAAQGAEDIATYQAKATLHAMATSGELTSIEERLWLKEVLHLSGGSPDIQEQIFRKLGQMASVLEDSSFGANVETIKKHSTDAVTTALTAEILRSIDSGLSILTFFGHSSAGTFDFSVEDPSIYNNEGRLPVVFSMGCHSGDIHETVNSLSEQFILTPEKGSIAFIAASGNAFIDPLSVLGQGFYTKMGANFFGQPVGLAIQEIQQEMFERVRSDYDAGPMIRGFFDTYVDVITLIEQNTLHGDPAITLFTAEEPDYVVDFASLSTEGVVGTTDAEVTLSFDILNLGRNITSQTLNNYVLHSYGDGKVDTTFFTTDSPSSKERVTVSIPNPGREALGKNSINIVLDHDLRVSEVPAPDAELNNDMMVAWGLSEGFCYYAFDNSAMPVYPPEFGVVGSQDISLVASSSNALAPQAVFILELDTTETFDSPFLVTEEKTSFPSAIRWNPGVTYQNETVYYWRIIAKDQDQAIWSSSSFVYLEGENQGWNQSHFYQWARNDFNNSGMEESTRDWRFVENINEIRIKNGVASDDGFLPEIIYQNRPTQYLKFSDEISSGVYISTFDAVTGRPMENNPGPGDFGSHLSALWVEDFISYPYRTDTPEQRANAINFIENVVPDGDYVALFTIQRADLGRPDYKPELWAADGANGGPDLFSVLEKYGAEQVRSLADEALPYIIVFKKNDPSFPVIEIVAPDTETEISTELKIVARWHEGEMQSTRIGPAQSWDKLLWNLEDIDHVEDEFTFDVIGCNADGDNETVLFQGVDEFELDLSQVDASTYPYLKLNFFATDLTSRTAPQMEYWRILYEGLPEAVLDIGAQLVYNADSLLMGEDFSFRSIATNISDVDMDSLLVEYVVTDNSNQTKKLTERLGPLKAKESIPLEFNFSTVGQLGLNEFKVEINPDEDQPEKHFFNNLGIRTFHVEGDNINPLLDVTFDGVRIMNGDIVAAAPIVTAVLKDENQNQPISDMSSFEFSLLQAPSRDFVKLDLSQENVTFTPADSTNNYCARLEWTPEPPLESGDYSLQVQGFDASGNLSGDLGMTIDFQVVNESSVSNVLNYPNPFSTHTEFVFTLTGRAVPDVFTIQIFTLSGKVVKEITKEELGNLRLGTNRTDYKWTGTDDYGNPLANGVYLYRVITSEVEGEELKHLENRNVDSFFDKGFGKMVILR